MMRIIEVNFLGERHGNVYLRVFVDRELLETICKQLRKRKEVPVPNYASGGVYAGTWSGRASRAWVSHGGGEEERTEGDPGAVKTSFFLFKAVLEANAAGHRRDFCVLRFYAPAVGADRAHHR